MNDRMRDDEFDRRLREATQRLAGGPASAGLRARIAAIPRERPGPASSRPFGLGLRFAGAGAALVVLAVVVVLLASTLPRNNALVPGASSTTKPTPTTAVTCRLATADCQPALEAAEAAARLQVPAAGMPPAAILLVAPEACRTIPDPPASTDLCSAPSLPGPPGASSLRMVAIAVVTFRAGYGRAFIDITQPIYGSGPGRMGGLIIATEPASTPAASVTPPSHVAPSPAPATASGWPVTLPGPVANVRGPFVTGSDGTVYVATAGDVAALGPTGMKSGWPFAPSGIDQFETPVAGPDGTVYVVGRPPAGAGNQGELVWALDASSRPLGGWPYQADRVVDALVVASDGTAYVVESGPSGTQVVALDAAGQMKPGWPVALPGGPACGGVSCGPSGALIGADGTLYEQVATSTANSAPIEIVALAPDGSERPGWPVRVPGEGMALGPDGNVYAWGVETGAPAAPNLPPMHILRTTYTILGSNGRPLPGWPVTIQGPSSPPAIAPDGSIVVTVGGEKGQPQRVEAIRTDGKVAAGWPYTLPSGVEAWPYAIGEGSPARLSPPWIAPDGTAYLAVSRSADPQSEGLIALGGGGSVQSGWPVWLPAGTQLQMQAVFTTGGGGNLRAPAFATDGTIDVPVIRDNHGAVLALAPNGALRPGWPFVTSGAFQLVVGLDVGADGTLYVATQSGSGPAQTTRLYAVRPDGRLAP